MAREWRCAVVGTGTVGGWHVGIIPKLPGCRLVAVCDLDGGKGKAAIGKYSIDVPVYTSLAEMFAAMEIDSVHVCTPSGDHEGPATESMRRGKNVIVEKPLEIQTERIDRMVEASKKFGVRLAGIFQNRWNPANIAIREAVAAGRFGRIAWAGSFTPWYRPDKYYQDVNWRGTWRLDGGGAVMNQGVHQVDLMQWVVGPVKSVSAYASSRIHASIETEDTMTCALEFAGGGYGTFVSSTAMWPGSPTRLEVSGEFGTAVSENGLKRYEFKEPLPRDQELLQRLSPALAGNKPGGAKTADIGLDLHGQNMLSIYQAWEENRDAETSGVEARKAVAIVEAMYESVRKKGASVEVR